MGRHVCITSLTFEKKKGRLYMPANNGNVATCRGNGHIHGPACIAFHCSHIHVYITNPGSVSHFAKKWVSLQATTYISVSTQHFDILLLLTREEVVHAPTVQI